MQANLADLKHVQDLAQAAVATVHDEPIHYAVVPDAYKVVSLAEMQFSERPQRKKGVSALHDAESFCQYFNRFADPNSVIFVDTEALSFTGVLNYHEALEGVPRFGDFRCSFFLRETEPWKLWKGGNAKQMSQVAFAQFIEENLSDILSPPAAAMRELSRDLQVKSDVEFQQATRLANGQTKLVYKEELKATIGSGSQEVPEEFTIRLALYQGQAPRDIKLRLRLRLASGKLSMWWEIPRLEEILHEEMDLAASKIKEACSAPTFYGKP